MIHGMRTRTSGRPCLLLSGGCRRVPLPGPPAPAAPPNSQTHRRGRPGWATLDWPLNFNEVMFTTLYVSRRFRVRFPAWSAPKVVLEESSEKCLFSSSVSPGQTVAFARNTLRVAQWIRRLPTADFSFLHPPRPPTSPRTLQTLSPCHWRRSEPTKSEDGRRRGGGVSDPRRTTHPVPRGTFLLQARFLAP